jgi:hypothetical protein
MLRKTHQLPPNQGAGNVLLAWQRRIALLFWDALEDVSALKGEVGVRECAASLATMGETDSAVVFRRGLQGVLK